MPLSLVALFSSEYMDPFAIQLVRASPRNTTSNYQIYYIVSHRPADVIVFRGQFSETRNAICNYDAAEVCESARELAPLCLRRFAFGKLWIPPI